MGKRRLELLAPARNMECGMAAIDHGADAVYIGAPQFGARAAAGNSLDDIRQLCEYAHAFMVRVYVTVNTIVYDSEIDSLRRLLLCLADIGVDACLVQDMGVVEIARECLATDTRKHTMALHASTQTDNRTIEKVRWLRDLGFSRVVLARELSVEEIRTIHKAVPDVELEVFVHGALCVSFSGLCYASQHCFGRSANRGECAQFCRLKFDMLDADGKVISHERHLLSLKDMCQIDNMEALAEAGAVSFKIEGRLKDATYVKNVTAAYSQRLDDLVARHPDIYRRSSLGRCTYHFTPNLSKTFNRGFTSYFANGRRPGLSSPETPKALGEYVGKVKEVRGNYFTVAGVASFANGDGLCFINAKRELEGFRVNRVENNKLYPLAMPRGIRPGASLYRNNDQEFERLLSRQSSLRKIPFSLGVSVHPDGIHYRAMIEGCEDVATGLYPYVPSERSVKPQRENIIRQLSKLGTTHYVCTAVHIADTMDWFIPSSVLSNVRRDIVDCLDKFVSRDLHINEPLASDNHQAHTGNDSHHDAHPTPPAYPYGYMYNVSNAISGRFYEECKLSSLEPAFERQHPASGIIMQCRFCLRYEMGWCVKNGGSRSPYREPYSLALPDGRVFGIEFDCRNCQMNIRFGEDNTKILEL